MLGSTRCVGFSEPCRHPVSLEEAVYWDPDCVLVAPFLAKLTHGGSTRCYRHKSICNASSVVCAAMCHACQIYVRPALVQSMPGQCLCNTVCQFSVIAACEQHAQVAFSPDKSSLTSMQSMAGETVALDGGVWVTDTIEAWLSNLAK